MSFQDRANHYVSQLDKELSNYPILVNLEKQTGAPKAYVIGGVAVLYFILVIFNFGGQTLTNLAGFIVPGYYSLHALFTTTKTDDAQWVTYWMLFGFFSVLESIFSVTYWIPFWYAAKLLVLVWAGLPQTRGGDLLFRNFLAPLVSKHFQNPSFVASSGLRSKVDAATTEHKTL